MLFLGELRKNFGKFMRKGDTKVLKGRQWYVLSIDNLEWAGSFFFILKVLKILTVSKRYSIDIVRFVLVITLKFYMRVNSDDVSVD